MILKYFCIISHTKLEMTLCNILCMKVCTDLYSSRSGLCWWITLSLGLYMSRRRVSVNVFVLVPENGLFQNDACFETKNKRMFKLGMFGHNKKNTLTLVYPSHVDLLFAFLCGLLLVLLLKKHCRDNVQFIHRLFCT